MTPSEPNDEVRVTTRFDPGLHEKISERADRMNRSLNWLINDACRRYVTPSIPTPAAIEPVSMRQYQVVMTIEVSGVVDKDEHVSNIIHRNAQWTLEQDGVQSVTLEFNALSPMATSKTSRCVYQNPGRTVSLPEAFDLLTSES